MKKLLTIFAVLMMLSCFGFSFGLAEPSDLDQINNKIVKIEKEIKRLQAKLKGSKSKTKEAELMSLIGDHKANVEKLKKDRETIMLPLEKTVPTPIEPDFVEEVPVAEEIPKNKEEKLVRGLNFEIGGAVGVFAGATNLNGELRFQLPFVFGPVSTSLRVCAGLAQSRDATKRYAPIQLDGVFNFPAGRLTGVENYLGAGINYLVRSTGGGVGTFGGELFYGVESDGFGGKVFGELGYGILRQGVASSHQGVTVLIGYRRAWGI